jgi:hypothetical protein
MAFPLRKGHALPLAGLHFAENALLALFYLDDKVQEVGALRDE